MRLDRRGFLLGLGGVALTRCKKERSAPAPASVSPRASPAAAPAPAAAPVTADTLDALLDRLIPAAGDARVRRYFDRQLAEPHFKQLGGMVRHGVKLLDKVALREGGGAFVALPDASKDQLLARFQAGDIRTKFPTAKWFAIVHTLALEGWLGDPSHGGNADGRGWGAIGWQLQCPTG